MAMLNNQMVYSKYGWLNQVKSCQKSLDIPMISWFFGQQKDPTQGQAPVR